MKFDEKPPARVKEHEDIQQTTSRLRKACKKQGLIEKDALTNALYIGRLLIRAKKQVGHGNFKHFVKTIGFAYRTSRKYMSLYREREKIEKCTSIAQALNKISKVNTEDTNQSGRAATLVRKRKESKNGKEESEKEKKEKKDWGKSLEKILNFVKNLFSEMDGSDKQKFADRLGESIDTLM